MRLILVVRWAARQLCRVGLHKWGRVREITSLDFKDTALMPDGTLDLRFWATGNRYAIKCMRPRCRAEQGARRRWRNVGGHAVRDRVEPPISARPPEPPS